MSVTYKITNFVSVPDMLKIRVFYEFSNGETNSELFDLDVTLEDAQNWGQSRAAFFDWREAELIRLAEELALQNEGGE